MLQMILQSYISSEWLQQAFTSWAQRCQKADSAETIEMLTEVIFMLHLSSLSCLDDRSSTPLKSILKGSLPIIQLLFLIFLFA